MKKFVSVLLLVLLPSVAPAQSALVGTDLSSALTTVTTNCVPPNAARKTLTLHSPSQNAVPILYCVRNAATPTTPCTITAGNPGTWTISPNEKLFWSNGSALSNGIDCAAASATATIDVLSEN